MARFNRARLSSSTAQMRLESDRTALQNELDRCQREPERLECQNALDLLEIRAGVASIPRARSHRPEQTHSLVVS